MHRRRIPITVVALTLLLSVSQALSGQSPYVLSPEEEQLAVDLALEQLEAEQHRIERPLYLAEVDLMREKPLIEGDPTGRFALVTHYRYKGNLAILTTVDLETAQVVEAQAVPDVPTRLSEAELDLAVEMAFSDPAVVDALGEDGTEVEVEGTVVRYDPFTGPRLFRLLFRIGADYLSAPIVLVNLTDLDVSIETLPAGEMPFAKAKKKPRSPSTEADSSQSPPSQGRPPEPKTEETT